TRAPIDSDAHAVGPPKRALRRRARRILSLLRAFAQRHETHERKLLLVRPLAVSGDPQQRLSALTAGRDHEAAAIGKLGEQLRRHLRGCRGNDDAIERCLTLPTVPTVGVTQTYV